MAKMIMPDEPPKQEELPLAARRHRGRRPAEQKVELAETFEEGERPANIIMAAGQGAQTGVKLAVAVGAMVLPSSPWSRWPTASCRHRRLVRRGGPHLPEIVGTIFQPVMF
jgi:hypothetical protein